jgi:hypothetical protein
MTRLLDDDKMIGFGKPKDPPPPPTRAGYAKDLRIKRLLDLLEDTRAEMLRGRGLEKQNLAEAVKFIEMALECARKGV